LLTAHAPTDHLAAEYGGFLQSGDGPAFWSLHARDLASVTDKLSALGLSPANDGDLVAFP